MNYIFVLAVFVVAVFMGWVIIPQIVLIAFRKRLFDAVDNRKVHLGIIPRLGGISFAPVQCCLMVLSIFFVHKLRLDHVDASSLIYLFLLLICGLVLLFLMGVKDDLIGVNYRWKFAVQLLVALFFPLSDLWINNLYGLLGVTTLPPFIGMPLTILLVVFIINAVNLIDGLDGLCSGLVGMACLVLGALFICHDSWLHAVFSFITAGVLIPFFYYNVHGVSPKKQRVFMGDTGSLTLGLSVSFLAVSYAMDNPLIKPFDETSLMVAFATLLVPMLDVLRVMLVRLRLNKPVFQPDRNHIHHKLLRLGFSHRSTMLTILLLELLFVVLNVLLTRYVDNNALICMDFILWSVFHLTLDRVGVSWQKEERKKVNHLNTKKI